MPVSEQPNIANGVDGILESEGFRGSEVLCKLLRYLAKRAVEQPGVSVKEFQIATEALGRSDDFDPRIDSNVRVQTARLRTKLMEYYSTVGANDEFVFEIPKGAYVLYVRPRASRMEQLPAVEATHPTVINDSVEGVPGWRYGWACALVIICLGAAVVGWQKLHRQNSVQRFWQPVLLSPNSVLVSLGQVRVGEAELTPNASRSRFSGVYRLCDGQCAEGNGRGFVALFDSNATANVAAVLKNGNKSFSIRDQQSSSFGDLQKGPFVLIGAFSNDWTIRLSDPLRFHFDMDPASQTWWIADRNHPNKRIGSVRTDQPFSARKQDFAIVVRAFEPSTGQIAVIIAGVGGQGTQAAGEFVSSPGLLDQVVTRGPKDWYRKNMELLISTDIVDGQSGPPHLVDSTFW